MNLRWKFFSSKIYSDKCNVIFTFFHFKSNIMKQYKKKHKKTVKQEKRIVKLMYQKGLLHDFNLIDKILYWEAYKPDGSKFGYIPEIHFDEIDYWGEVSEFSVIDVICDNMFGWDGEKECPKKWGGFVGYSGRRKLLNHLNKLPTKYRKSKFNQMLRNWN